MNDDEDLDVHEPYQAHAYFALAFTCEVCRSDLEAPNEGEQFSYRWYRALALKAKELKWHVPQPDKKGNMDVMRTWCPECADRIGRLNIK